MTDKWFVDVECFPNVFMVGFSELESDHCSYVILRNDEIVQDEKKDTLTRLLHEWSTFGFNSINYDIPMIEYCLQLKTPRELFRKSQSIIEGESKIPSWKDLRYRHIDLIRQVLGIPVGLKMYGARLHFPVISELPFEPDSELDEGQIKALKMYNLTDIELTKRLFLECKSVIQTKHSLGKMFSVNVLNARSSQIGETIINKVSGLSDRKALSAPSLSGRWTVPKWIGFDTEPLRDLLTEFQDKQIDSDTKGRFKADVSASIGIGQNTYRIGIGGLHSTEKSRVDKSDNDYRIIELDVKSYYPSLIKSLGIGGEKWSSAYSKIYNTRMKMLDEGIKETADALKLVLNSTFGQLGNQYSSLYSPDDFINITLSGQFGLLMLIEKMERTDGVELISANTDSVTVKCARNRIDSMKDTASEWEKMTEMKLDLTEYRSRYARDVNNYCAKLTGKVSTWKGKGLFSDSVLQVNPFGRIIVKALQSWWDSKIHISETVNTNKDIRDFLMVRKVKDGAVYQDEPIGSVIRWIWSVDGDNIYYKTNKNLVPQAQNVIPVQSFETAEQAMKRIDLGRYIDKTQELLELIEPENQFEQQTLI